MMTSMDHPTDNFRAHCDECGGIRNPVDCVRDGCPWAQCDLAPVKRFVDNEDGEFDNAPLSIWFWFIVLWIVGICLALIFKSPNP